MSEPILNLNPEAGVKQECPNCGCRFFDFNRPSPLTCPSCQFSFSAEAVILRSRRGKVAKGDEENVDFEDDERDEDDDDIEVTEDDAPVIVGDGDDEDENDGIAPEALESDDMLVDDEVEDADDEALPDDFLDDDDNDDLEDFEAEDGGVAPNKK